MNFFVLLAPSNLPTWFRVHPLFTKTSHKSNDKDFSQKYISMQKKLIWPKIILSQISYRFVLEINSLQWRVRLSMRSLKKFRWFQDEILETFNWNIVSRNILKYECHHILYQRESRINYRQMITQLFGFEPIMTFCRFWNSSEILLQFNDCSYIMSHSSLISRCWELLIPKKRLWWSFQIKLLIFNTFNSDVCDVAFLNFVQHHTLYIHNV